MRQKLSLLLVDDHAVVRAGFRMLLQSHEVIGDVIDVDCGELVGKFYREIKPDVVVMDLSMPGIGGLEAIRRLCVYDPAVKILVYSIHHESIYVERALQAGAKGYLTKNTAAEILSEAVMAVADGKIFIEHGLLDQKDIATIEGELNYRKQVDRLSQREFEVFLRLARGMDSHAIAKDLNLSYKTIANYNTQIKSRLNVKNSAELAKIASILNLID